jgi:hypothetical protein
MTTLASGAPIAVVPSKELILESIDAVKPTHFSAVPLLINRVKLCLFICDANISYPALQWNSGESRDSSPI